MQRYIYNKILKNKTVHDDSPHANQAGYDTTLMPKIVRDPRDPIIIATAVDRLDLLAHRFYKDATLWWIIALANNIPGDSFFVEPGTQLFIPKNSAAIINGLKRKNDV